MRTLNINYKQAKKIIKALASDINKKKEFLSNEDRQSSRKALLKEIAESSQLIGKINYHFNILKVAA